MCIRDRGQGVSAACGMALGAKHSGKPINMKSRKLKKMGTAAAILGKSLYTGALDLVRCVQLMQE